MRRPRGETVQRQPLASFITFRCYGTWLPGDERGWIDRRANAPGTSTRPSHAGLISASQAALSHSPISLEAQQRTIVDHAIRDVCVHRSWTLHALNVRTNHVHLVVSADSSPEQVMTTIKAWSTRRLREARLVKADARVWSRHGSTRYLWTNENIETACRYVIDEQGRNLH